MKKYLLLLIVLVGCSFAKAGTPIIVSSSPVQGGYISNSDMLVLTFSEPIRANTTISTAYTIVATFGLTVYSSKGGYYDDVALSHVSPYVKINPLDNTQLLIDLSPYGIVSGDSYTIILKARSIYSTSTNSPNTLTTLTYVGAPTTLISHFPINNAIDVLPNDTIRLTYSASVDFALDPGLIFNIVNADNSPFWSTTSEDPLAEIIINNNIVEIAGNPSLPLFIAGSTYKVIIDDYFFTPLIAGFVDGDWTFTVNEITTVAPFLPVVGTTTASGTSDFSITFSDNIVANSGYIYIKDYADNSLVEQINVSSCTVSGATLTIPHAALSGATHYYIEMSKGIVKSSSTGYRFRGISGNSIWEFTTENVNIWEGTLSDDFETGGNWSSGAYDPSQPTIIGGGTYPTKITTSINATDVTITASGKLEVASTGSLTISGKLTMASSSTSNSSLVVNGTLSVDPSNVYIYQFAGNTGSLRKGYASPVVGATGTTAGTTQLILKFDNPTAKFVSVAPSATWDACVGYATYASSPLIFKGAINTSASYSMPLIYTSDPGGGAIYSSPYNFYGNPYTAPLDWKKMWTALSPADTMLVRQTCWVLKESGSWKTINGKTGAVTGGSGTAIPRGHAFALRAKPPVGGEDASNTIVFNKSDLVAGNQTFLKSLTTEVLPTNLRFTAVSNNYQTDIIYGFHSEALSGYEDYDSEYQSFPTSSAAYDDRLQISTYTSSLTPISLAINTAPVFVDSTSFNIAYYVKKEGPYAIELTEVDPIFKKPNTVILLTDTVMNETIPMVEGDRYYFYTGSTASVVKNRFKIKIKSVEDVPTAVIPSVNVIKQSVVYSFSDIHVALSNDQLQRIEVYNINGTKLLSREVSGKSAIVPFEGSGVYVVKVITDKGTSSHKIVASGVR